MPSTRAIVALGLTLLLAACSAPRPRDTASHRVLAGETLYSIAFGHGLDYREVADWNRIAPPYTIYPGQQLVLAAPARATPVEDRTIASADAVRPAPLVVSRPIIKPLPTPAPVPAVSPTPAPLPATAPAPPPVPAKRQPHPPASPPAPALPAGEPSRWFWPTDGQVTGRFAPANGRKGIDITGKPGQSVLASAPGVVVYSGNGLLGYGNLVIVKHSDSYLSAYGHNRKLLVKEGESVSSGQKIAEMGQNGKSLSILHFEIRKDGKPVDPIRYLPRRN